MNDENCANVFKQPTQKLKFNQKLKKAARDEVYFNHTKTFYCDCDFTVANDNKVEINTTLCSYVIKNSDSGRGKNLEWEHIVPASVFGKHIDSWAHHKNERFCGSDSKSGRDCSRKHDQKFMVMEADLHNLVPEIGKLNADRGNKPYGNIAGEAREYGKCDFEVSTELKLVEPAEHIQGEIARTWLYMYMTYSPELVPTSNEDLQMFCDWHKKTPVSDWEKIRNERIAMIQGNSNPYVDGEFGECIEVCGTFKTNHDEL